MTDGQLLFLCLAGFYLLECIHWLPPGFVSFRAWRPDGRWSVGRSKLEFSLAGFQPHLGPLLPAGGFFATQSWPVLLEPDGIRSGVSLQGQGWFLRWEDVEVKPDDRRIWLGGGHMVQLRTAGEANELAILVHRLKRSSVDERESLIDLWWSGSTHPSRVRRAHRLRRLVQREIGFQGWMVFAWCFGVIPVVYWFVGWEGYSLLMAVAALLLLQLDIAVRRFFLEKHILKRPAGERWLEAIQTFFLPLHAMKAAEAMGIGLTAGIHPVAIASALLREREARPFVGRAWRDWRFLPASTDARPRAIWAGRLEAWMDRLGWPTEELEAPPAPQPGEERYCPRCHVGFSASALHCQDCAGIGTIEHGM